MFIKRDGVSKGADVCVGSRERQPFGYKTHRVDRIPTVDILILRNKDDVYSNHAPYTQELNLDVKRKGLLKCV